MTLAVTLLTLMQSVAPEVARASESLPVKPTSVTGYLNLFGLIVGAVAVPFAWGKWVQNMNAFGARMSEIEKEQAAAKAERHAAITLVQRMSDAQERLLERIGEAKTESGLCKENMAEYAQEVGTKIFELGRTIESEGRQAGERLRAVETKLDFLMRERERDDRFRRTDTP